MPCKKAIPKDAGANGKPLLAPAGAKPRGKVGEGIVNPFPKGALLAPRASGKPLPIPAGMVSCSVRLEVRKADSKGLRNPLVVPLCTAFL